MMLAERLQRNFPHAFRAEIDQYIAAGRAYAKELEKLPAAECEAVAQLVASFGLCKCMIEKRAYRASIDVIIRPWYPKAGARNAAFTP